MKFLDTFYEIDFASKDKVTTLTYQIVDTPVSQIWLDRVRWIMQVHNYSVFENQWANVLPDSKEIIDLWGTMKHLVDETNSKQYVDVDFIDMPDVIDPTADNQKMLNYLHHVFHMHIEKVGDTHRTYNPLVQLNVYIHKLEKLVLNLKNIENTIVNYSFFLHGDVKNSAIGGDHTVPILDKSLYKYWDHPDKFGDLLLGYHTIGKNIHHCCLDNDIELVKTGGVRPQTTIGNEVILQFRRGKTDISNQHKMIDKWIKNNNLESFIDMSAPENRVAALPLLGRIQDTYSIEEISDLFKTSKVTTTRLIEK